MVPPFVADGDLRVRLTGRNQRIMTLQNSVFGSL
jgi:hypothetical protein